MPNLAASDIEYPKGARSTFTVIGRLTLTGIDSFRLRLNTCKVSDNSVLQDAGQSGKVLGHKDSPKETGQARH